MLSLTLLAAPACSKPREAETGAGRAAPAAGDTVRVVFALPGDDIGSPETAALLERIKAAIVARGAGDVVGAGYGMGTMELVVRLRGPGLSALEQAVRAEYPAARYRVDRQGR